MRKIWVLMILCAMIIASSVSAVKILEFEQHEMKCTIDGVCKFNFFYSSGDTELNLDKTKVYADGERINGDWVDRDGDEIHTLKAGKRANFVSDDGEFYNESIYDMKIDYTDDNGQISSLPFRISSPGYSFSCELFKLVLDKCYTKDGNFYMEITADGFGRFWDEDLKKRVDFYLPGTWNRHEGILDGSDAVIKQTGKGYEIMVPLGYSVGTANIKGMPYGCDKTEQYSDTITWKKCEVEAKVAPKAEPETPKITAAVVVETKPEASGNLEETAKQSAVSKLWNWFKSIFKKY